MPTLSHSRSATTTTDRDQTGGADPSTDPGLRHAVRAIGRSGTWDCATGQHLLGEIRRRAARNAAHVAASTGVPMSRGLVDDVLLAAWLVLHRHGDKVVAALNLHNRWDWEGAGDAKVSSRSRSPTPVEARRYAKRRRGGAGVITAATS